MTAVATKINTILLRNYVRIPELRQFKDLIDGTDEDVVAVADLTADKTALKTAIDTLVDARAVVIASDKTAAKDAINALIQALIDTPPEDGAAWLAAMAALKTSQAAAITAEIDATVTALKTDIHTAVDANIDSTINANYSDIFTSAIAVYKAAIAAYEVEGEPYFGYGCIQCKEDGELPANTIAGAIDPDNETKVKCPGCDGLTKRHTPNSGLTVFDAAAAFPDKLPE